MFEYVVFTTHKKASVCFVVTCAAIAVCMTPVVDGLWRVTVYVVSHTARR